jgi:hypothetical protein
MEFILRLAIRYPLVLSLLGILASLLGGQLLRDAAVVPTDANNVGEVDAIELAAAVPRPGRFTKLRSVEWRCDQGFDDSATHVVPGIIAGRRRIFAHLKDGMACDTLAGGSFPGTVEDIWPAFAGRLEKAGVDWKSPTTSTLEFWVDPGGKNALLYVCFGTLFLVSGLLLAVFGVIWWRRPPYWQRVWVRLADGPTNTDVVVLPNSTGNPEHVPFKEFGKRLRSGTRLSRLNDEQLRIYIQEAFSRSMWRDVLRAATMAVERAPEDERAVCDAARAWIMVGKKRRARETLDRWSKRHGQTPRLVGTLAIVEHQLGNVTAAEELARRALVSDPNQSDALAVQARLREEVAR